MQRVSSVLFRITMLLLLALIGNHAHTQNNLLNLQENSGKTTAWMKTNLALSESQAPDAEDINVQYESRNLVLLTNYLGRKQVRQLIARNEQKRDEDLRKILTAAQFNTWLARKKEIEMFNGKQAKTNKVSIR